MRAAISGDQSPLAIAARLDALPESGAAEFRVRLMIGKVPALLQGWTVTARRDDRRVSRSVRTDAGGVACISVPPGSYEIDVARDFAPPLAIVAELPSGSEGPVEVELNVAGRSW